MGDKIHRDIMTDTIVVNVNTVYSVWKKKFVLQNVKLKKFAEEREAQVSLSRFQNWRPVCVWENFRSKLVQISVQWASF
jgi:hypothetical protein